MMESVQLRQRGGYDFESHYDNLCAMQNSCPLPPVKAHLAQNVLDLNGDRIRANDWAPILNTLKINKSLEFIAIRSYYKPPTEENEKKAFIEKRKMPSVRSKGITHRLCKALKECLSHTPNLTCLELQGLPLREVDLQVLMKGLVKNSTLSHLSLEYCRVGDNGLEVICKGIKNSTTINSVNFTGCSLSSKGADSLAKVVKHQAMKRHNEAWRDSLRYRRPDLDRMSGIRRITINNNPLLGDTGALYIAEALKDDLWLKALDMQGCGISTQGARALLEVLKYNTTMVVLDVRRNPLIDRDVLHSIMDSLMINCNGQDTEYKWIKAEEPVDPSKAKTPNRKRRTKTLNSSFGRKTTIKISAGASRRTRSVDAMRVTRKLLPFGSEGVKVGPGMPWRTAARANRGLPPDHVPGKASLFESEETDPVSSPNHSASILITKEDEEDDTIQEMVRGLDDSALSTGVSSPKHMKIEIIQLRRQLQQEKAIRALSDKKVLKLEIENKRLREDYDRLKRSKLGRGMLEDDSVLETIEGAFQQFHQFLDLLRDAGLGQLITMAGLDNKESPFLSASQLPAVAARRETNGNGPAYAKHPKSTSTPNHGDPVSKLPPKYEKPILGQSNGFVGDISSSGHVSDSAPRQKEDLFQKKAVYFGDSLFENRHVTGTSAKDPTMTLDMDASFNKTGSPGGLAGRKQNGLYDKILQETSVAFGNRGGEDRGPSKMDKKVTSTPKGEEEGGGKKTWRDKLEEGKKDRTGETTGGEHKGKTWAKTLSEENVQDISEIESSYSVARDEDSHQPASQPKVVPREGSRLSDYNYSMDSFDLSERGEKVHLDGNLEDLEDIEDVSPAPGLMGDDSDNDDF